MNTLSTYILAVADGGAAPSDAQWRRIVELAQADGATLVLRPVAPSEAGAALRAAREAKGLPQSALAKQVGTTQQTIDRLERGETAHSRYLIPALERVGLRLEKPPQTDDYGAWLGSELSSPGRSQSALARFLGVDQSAINRAVHGLRRVKVEEAQKIEQYLAETAQWERTYASCFQRPC